MIRFLHSTDGMGRAADGERHEGRTSRRRRVAVVAALVAATCGKPTIRDLGGEGGHSSAIDPAPTIRFPAETDSNSPAHWIDGRLIVFNSVDNAHPEPQGWVPQRSTGDSLEDLAEPVHVRYLGDRFDGVTEGRQWLEATWKDEATGILYGWYHNEPWGLCPGKPLTAPRIGAVRSFDDGLSFEDLGLILEAPSGTLRCNTQNGYFAGGNGDFSVMLDPAEEYLYFVFSAYAGPVHRQGISLAWMRWSDRNAPQGKVYKWNDGDWLSPGRRGLASPIFPARSDWGGPNPDVFWGPSIHWNAYLEQYVILMNRAVSSAWDQDGIYASFGSSLDDPHGWSVPEKVFAARAGDDWYPQVFGLEEGGTDKRAGRVARLFVRGESAWTIDFATLRAQLVGEVRIAGAPVGGLYVSAWGHDRGDFFVTHTDPQGRFRLKGLVPDSLYNVAINVLWTPNGYQPVDPTHDVAIRNDVALVAGPDWARVDIELAR